MIVVPNNGDWRAEQLAEAAMEAANNEFVKALLTGKTSARDLMWTVAPGNYTTRGIAYEQDAVRAATARGIRERIMARRIDPREPCRKCGVRGDIGCKHRMAM